MNRTVQRSPSETRTDPQVPAPTMNPRHRQGRWRQHRQDPDQPGHRPARPGRRLPDPGQRQRQASPPAGSQRSPRRPEQPQGRLRRQGLLDGASTTPTYGADPNSVDSPGDDGLQDGPEVDLGHQAQQPRLRLRLPLGHSRGEQCAPDRPASTEIRRRRPRQRRDLDGGLVDQRSGLRRRQPGAQPKLTWVPTRTTWTPTTTAWRTARKIMCEPVDTDRTTPTPNSDTLNDGDGDGGHRPPRWTPTWTVSAGRR